MSKRADWSYQRKGWTSCTRSQEFLAKHDVAIKEETNATAKLGRERALEIAAAANKVIVAKGKKITTFDMKKDAPDPDTLLKHMLGPTGNLRAPTLVKGKTVLVGFNADQYDEVFG